MRLFGFILTMGFVLLSYSFNTPEEYKSNISKIVDKNQGDIKGCSKELKNLKEPIKGRLNLTWEVDEKGKARNISKDGGSIDNADLFHCLQKKIANWKFPKPPMDRVIDVGHEFLF